MLSTKEERVFVGFFEMLYTEPKEIRKKSCPLQKGQFSDTMKKRQVPCRRRNKDEQG